MVIAEIRRFFRSARILTGAGVIILGVGIGISALMLSLLFASSSLVTAGMRHVGFTTFSQSNSDGDSNPISWGNYEKLQEVFSGRANFAAYSTPISTKLMIAERQRPLKVAAISNGFFATFTEPMSAGRDFTEFEVEQPTHHYIIVGYNIAVTLFGLPPSALGQFLNLDGTQFEIIGVAPRQFAGTLGNPADAWVSAHSVIPLLVSIPAGEKIGADDWKQMSSFYALASSTRLSSNALSSSFSGLLRKDNLKDLDLHAAQGITRDPRRDEKIRRWLRLGIFLACALTLLTSLNYSLLLVARLPRYLYEVKLKRALGADARALLMDLSLGPAAMMLISLVVAATIYLFGYKIAFSLPAVHADMVHGAWMDNFLAFAIQVPFVCAMTVLIALLPILGVYRDNGMPRSNQTITASHASGLLIQIPVVAQITLCACIWVITGMVFSSCLAAIRAQLGFQPAHLKAVFFEPRAHLLSFKSDGTNTFPTRAEIESVLDAAMATPGVRNAAFSSDAPLQPKGFAVKLQPLDNGNSPAQEGYEIHVSPDYFKTMGTRIIQGRAVAWHGTLTAENEIVVSKLLADELWPGKNPINQRVNVTYPTFAGIESHSIRAMVVGVSENVRLSGPSSTPDPTFYSSVTQPVFLVNSCLIVDGTVSLNALENSMQTTIDKVIPVLKVSSESSNVWDDFQQSLRPERQRLYMSLCGAFIMGCLAYVGLYGALRHYVQARNRELAIRISFGATPWHIRKIVLKRAAWSACVAIAMCVLFWPLIAQLASNQYMGNLSWSTSRAVLIMLGCVFVSLCVSMLPARNAVAVSPAEVLKEQ